ncbi:tubulin-binding cofactor, partial [Cystoisospora suis]
SCLFSFKTQQLRVHDSQDVAFLLQISSSPIIERSTEAVFAPHLIKLRETYSSSSSCLTKEKEKEDHDREGQEKDRDNGGEENKRYVVQRTEEGEEEKKKGGSVNRWNDVKDFDWIKRQASPNWRGVLSLSSLPLRNFPTFFIHLEKKTNADIKKKTESEEESRDKEEEGKLSTASERSESLSISSSSSSSASPPLGGYKETACSNDSPSSSFLPSSVWSISSPSSSTFSSSSSLSSFFSYLFASSSSSSPSLNCETFNACQDEGAVIIVDRHFLDTLLRHVGLAGRLADCLAELSLCLGEKQRKYKNEEKEEEKGKKRHDVFTESKEDEKEEEEKISWCSASKPRISPKGDASRRREGPVAKQEGDEEEEEI